MKNPSELDPGHISLLDKLLGLGEGSIRKTYYPELQQRLEELERFRALIDHSNDVIFMIDVNSGLIVDANESAVVQTGWSRQELLQMSVLQLSGLGGLPEATSLLAPEGAQSADKALVTTELSRKDGSRFPVEINLVRMQFNGDVYLLAAARDITDRLRAEKALARSEAFLRNIVDNIPAMVFAKEAEELRFVAFNKAGEDLVGYKREEILGKNDHDFFPLEQAAFFTSKDREVLAQGELVEIPEETLKTRSGDDRILRTKKIPLFDEHGKAKYLLGIAEDITDRRRLEEQLLQAQKMEAIGHFAGGIAHDFNNILMVIMGYAGILQFDQMLDAKQKEKVQHIVTAAEKASQLTRSLLAFSRKQMIKPQIANLNDIVDNMRKFLLRIIGEDIRLCCILHEAKLDVNVDSPQIEQVLINLATNARDAMPKGGVLTIETSVQTLDPLFVKHKGLGTAGRYAVLSVSDSGVGMDSKTRGRVFEPFFTTKEVGKGTGLGMSIVYGIVKQHNGFVDLYSEPGAGTTFRIYIPIVPRQKEGYEAAALQALPEGGDERILVVEDDPAVRQFMEEVLSGYGYRVVLAEDGQQAVERFSECRGSFDLILMDVVMPRKSGKEACDEIKKLDPSVKIIFTSGYTMDVLKNRDVLEAEAELVMKPVQPVELLRKVREMLDK